MSVGIENYLNGEVIPLLEKRYLKITTLKFRGGLILRVYDPTITAEYIDITREKVS